MADRGSAVTVPIAHKQACLLTVGGLMLEPPVWEPCAYFV
jgi:hypothetical protein